MSAKGKTQAKMQSTTVDSHPKYSEMILEAIKDNKEQGKLNVSRPAILKFVTAKYQLDPTQASRHVNLNLKKMLESGAIKPAAAAGRKGAGSYRLGQPTKGKKVTKEKKSTKEKKPTKGKVTKGKKVNKAGSSKEMKVKIKGRKTEKSSTKGKEASGAKKKVMKSPTKPKKAMKSPTKPKKASAARMRLL